jgi:hypothetical protein
MSRYSYAGKPDAKHRVCDVCKAQDRDVNRAIDKETGKEVTVCSECSEAPPPGKRALW